MLCFYALCVQRDGINVNGKLPTITGVSLECAHLFQEWINTAEGNESIRCAHMRSRNF